jgi:hypothetical protein
MLCPNSPDSPLFLKTTRHGHSLASQNAVITLGAHYIFLNLCI